MGLEYIRSTDYEKQIQTDPEYLISTIGLYWKLNAIETSAKIKVENQKKVIALWKEIQQANPENSEVKQKLAGAYGNLSWHLLFTHQFEEAGKAAQKGLELDPSQEWIKTNLASSYLFTGQFEKAKAIYTELKDKTHNEKPFKEMFLEDLKELEKAGITHPDVAKARALLE